MSTETTQPQGSATLVIRRRLIAMVPGQRHPVNVWLDYPEQPHWEDIPHGTFLYLVDWVVPEQKASIRFDTTTVERPTKEVVLSRENSVYCLHNPGNPLEVIRVQDMRTRFPNCYFSAQQTARHNNSGLFYHPAFDPPVWAVPQYVMFRDYETPPTPP